MRNPSQGETLQRLTWEAVGNPHGLQVYHPQALHWLALDIGERCMLRQQAQTGHEMPKELWAAIHIKRMWLLGQTSKQEAIDAQFLASEGSTTCRWISGGAWPEYEANGRAVAACMDMDCFNAVANAGLHGLYQADGTPYEVEQEWALARLIYLHEAFSNSARAAFLIWEDRYPIPWEWNHPEDSYSNRINELKDKRESQPTP